MLLVLELLHCMLLMMLLLVWMLLMMLIRMLVVLLMMMLLMVMLGLVLRCCEGWQRWSPPLTSHRLALGIVAVVGVHHRAKRGQQPGSCPVQDAHKW